MIRNFLALCLFLFLLLGCDEKKETIESLAELNQSDRSVGYYEGQSVAYALPQVLPKAKKLSFNDPVTGYEAVYQGKLDGFAFERLQMEQAIESGLKGVKLLPETIGDTVNVSIGISRVSKIPDLKEKINAFIRENNENGILPQMRNRWLIRLDTVMPEIPRPKNPELVLHVGTSGVVPPYSYYSGTELTGFDIEFIRRFAQWLNADVQVKIYDYNSIVAAAVSGNIDIIVANLNETQERKEKIDFSDPLVKIVNAMMVKDDGASLSSASDTGLAAILNRSGATIGVGAGTVFESIAQKKFPLADIKYYNTSADLGNRVKEGALDGILLDEPVAQTLVRHIDGISIYPQKIDTAFYAIAFPKNEKGETLKKQIDEMLLEMSKDGSLERLQQIWLGKDENKKIIEKIPEVGKNGSLKIVTNVYNEPFAYVKEKKIVGYDIALVIEFCKRKGLGLQIVSLDYSAIIPALVSGLYDLSASGMTATEERKENILFSMPTYQGGTAVIVKSNLIPKASSADVPAQFLGKRLKYTSIEEMKKNEKLVLGMQNGFVFVDKEARRMLPNARIDYYNSTPDMAYLVSTGKIDGFINDEPVIRYAALNVPNLAYIHCGFEPLNIVVAFPKTEKGKSLRDEMNAFIEKQKAIGTLDSLDNLWLGHDESKKVVKFPKAKPGRPTLKMGTHAQSAPFEYVKDGKIVGYEMNLMALFCEEYGYGLEVNDAPFESLLLGLETSSYDFVASTLSEMPSVTERFYHTGAIYVSECVMAVQMLDDTTAVDFSFFQSLKNSFERTFVRESRWKLVVSGIGVTVFISVFAAILGSLLGFGICMLRRSGNSFANGIALTFIRVMQGTPMVVFLMILFYVVFAKTGLDGVWIAIIGFGLNFAAYVSEMMRTGIESVDKGQMEAALALGYRKAHAFFKIVFPQAARHFLPVYQGEFISLVKMTSVVGYIAIQDLTKASDIIRSRTYEAFFPLISTAIIYFLITWILTRALSALQNRLDPKKRRRRQGKY